jgi:hypothetical protein
VNRRMSLLAGCGLFPILFGCDVSPCRPSQSVEKLGFVIPASYFKDQFCQPAGGDSVIFMAIAPSMAAPTRGDETWKEPNHVSILVRPVRGLGRAQGLVADAERCRARTPCSGSTLVSSAGSVHIFSRTNRDASEAWYAVETLADDTSFMLEDPFASSAIFTCWRSFGPLEVRYTFPKTIPLRIPEVDAGVTTLLRRLAVDDGLRHTVAPPTTIDRSALIWLDPAQPSGSRRR